MPNPCEHHNRARTVSTTKSWRLKGTYRTVFQDSVVCLHRKVCVVQCADHTYFGSCASGESHCFLSRKHSHLKRGRIRVTDRLPHEQASDSGDSQFACHRRSALTLHSVLIASITCFADSSIFSSSRASSPSCSCNHERNSLNLPCNQTVENHPNVRNCPKTPAWHIPCTRGPIWRDGGALRATGTPPTVDALLLSMFAAHKRSKVRLAVGLLRGMRCYFLVVAE